MRSPTCPGPSTNTRGLGHKLPEKTFCVFKHVLAPNTGHYTGNFIYVPGIGEVYLELSLVVLVVSATCDTTPHKKERDSKGGKGGS